MNYSSNPAWVNRLLKENWAALAKRVDSSWLPAPVAGSSPKRPQFEEFGCGHYGCVMPSGAAPGIVMKVTSDPLEAHFVASALKIGKFPEGIVRYYAIYQLKGELRRRLTYAIWREEAQNVGGLQLLSRGQGAHLDQYDRDLHEQFSNRLMQFRGWANMFKETFDRSKDRPALYNRLKSLQDWAWDTVQLEDIERWWEGTRSVWRGGTRTLSVPERHRGAERLALALRGCEIIAEMMGSEEVGYLVGGALEFYLEHGLLLADVHTQNVGQVERADHAHPVWVITDPGHAVPLRPEADTVTVETA